jgi:hypothetical protein
MTPIGWITISLLLFPGALLLMFIAFTKFKDQDGPGIVCFLSGIVVLAINFGVIPMESKVLDKEKSEEEVQFSDISKTDEFITFTLKGEDRDPITKTEAKFVNKPFKAYKRFYRNLYGYSSYRIEYEFEDGSIEIQKTKKEEE